MLNARDICLYDGARALLPPLSVAAGGGELVKITGGNGSGKTTVLKILSGLLPPDAGAVRWQGGDIAGDADAYREQILYIAHQNAVADELTPLENLRAAAALRLRAPAASLERALADAGVGGAQNRRCRFLSAGQRRRAALARLRAFHARLWLLDEPLAALDERGRRMLGDWLAAHLAGGGVAVMTMHRAEDWPGGARAVVCGGRA